HSEMRLAFRLAFLAADTVFLSGSAYFENHLARRILKEHAALCEAGFVYVTAKDPTLVEHFLRKGTVHYTGDSPEDLKAAYRRMRRVPVLYRSARIDLSGVIKESWFAALETDSFARFAGSRRRPLERDFDRIWARIPEV